MGLYRLLSEWGMTFVRPNKDGTVYPEKCDVKDIGINERPSKRHRVMCKKVLFLLGYNTFWLSAMEEIRNRENTVFMLAPICRNYFILFPDEVCDIIEKAER